eukprot:UN18720
MIIWDLRQGADIKITNGPGLGFEGKVKGMYDDVHYAVSTPLQREGHKQHGTGWCTYVLGAWWLDTATKGLWGELPFVNIKP